MDTVLYAQILELELGTHLHHEHCVVPQILALGLCTHLHHEHCVAS